MPKFSRPCLKCGGLSKNAGSYCPAHTLEVAQARELKRTLDPRRKEKKKQLYNSDYRKAREQIVAYVREYGAICYLCNNPITATDYIDIDHLAPGDPFSQLAPTHRTCNRSRGNKPL